LKPAPSGCQDCPFQYAILEAGDPPAIWKDPPATTTEFIGPAPSGSQVHSADTIASNPLPIGRHCEPSHDAMRPTNAPPAVVNCPATTN
jgi:hypothetical protein